MLDEFFVLESVADDRHLRIGHRDDGQQLGLAARFDAEAILAAVTDDLLDDVALLVDLDRKHTSITILVIDALRSPWRSNRSIVSDDRQECR